MIFHAPRCMGGTCTCMTENGRKENNRCAKAQGMCWGRGKDRSGDSNSIMLIIWKKTLRQLKAVKAIACNFNLINVTNHELNAKNLRVIF